MTAYDPTGDAERMRFLISLPAVEAQAFFWNYTGRRARRAAIDKAMLERGVRAAVGVYCCAHPDCMVQTIGLSNYCMSHQVVVQTR